MFEGGVRLFPERLSRDSSCLADGTTCLDDGPHHEPPPAPHRDPGLSDNPGAGRLLLRGQDAPHPGTGGRGAVLLPVPPAPLRQEPPGGYSAGTVRGKRGPVQGSGHPRALELVGPSPGRGAELWREVQRAGRPGAQHAQPVGDHRTRRRSGAGAGRGHRTGAPAQSPVSPASRHRPARRGAGGRVRQADPGRTGNPGPGEGEPRLSAGFLRDHQGQRPTRTVCPGHRGEHVLEGEPVFGPQQPGGHQPGRALRHDLRVHGRGPGPGVRPGVAGSGSGRDPALVQRLSLAR